MNERTFERTARTLALLIIAYYIILALKSIITTYQFVIDYVEIDLWFFLDMMKLPLFELFVMFLGGALLIAFKKKGLTFVMSICAILLAVDCLIDAYLLLIEYRELAGGDLSMFLEGVFSLVIAFMLLFNTVIYMRGLSRSAKLIKYGVLAIILLQVLFLIIEIRDPEYTWGMIYELRSESIPLYLMLFLVFWMTTSKTVTNASIMGNIGTSIRDMRNSMTAEGVGIDRPTASKFIDFNEKGLWCSSYSFMLSAYNLDGYSVTLDPQDGKMMLSIASVENRSGMNNFRFQVTGVWFDTGNPSTCDTMRFYGTDGMYIQLIVREVPKPKSRKFPKIKVLSMMSREIGTRSYAIRVKVTDIIQSIRERVHGLIVKIRKKVD